MGLGGSRYVYSSLLAQAASVSGQQSLGGPPPGYLWVVRMASFTYGAYIGYVVAGLGLSSAGPWSYMFSTATDAIIGVRKQSKIWEGRLVVPAGASLWATVEAPDTGDFIISGYQLQAAPVGA